MELSLEYVSDDEFADDMSTSGKDEDMCEQSIGVTEQMKPFCVTEEMKSIGGTEEMKSTGGAEEMKSIGVTEEMIDSSDDDVGLIDSSDDDGVELVVENRALAQLLTPPKAPKGCSRLRFKSFWHRDALALHRDDPNCLVFSNATKPICIPNLLTNLQYERVAPFAPNYRTADATISQSQLDAINTHLAKKTVQLPKHVILLKVAFKKTGVTIHNKWINQVLSFVMVYCIVERGVMRVIDMLHIVDAYSSATAFGDLRTFLNRPVDVILHEDLPFVNDWIDCNWMPWSEIFHQFHDKFYRVTSRRAASDKFPTDCVDDKHGLFCAICNLMSFLSRITSPGLRYDRVPMTSNCAGQRRLFWHKCGKSIFLDYPIVLVQHSIDGDYCTSIELHCNCTSIELHCSD